MPQEVINTPQIMQYIFETIVSIGITLMLFVLKDFKESLKNLTDNLNKLTLSVTTLIEKDNSREESLAELKQRVSNTEKRVRDLELKTMRISLHKGGKE